MNINSVIQNNKDTIIKYLIKGAGAAALGIVGYDAHVVGRLQSDVYAKSKDADACIETFNNAQHLSSPSQTTAKLKDSVHKLEMDSNIRHFVNSAIGYFKGFGTMLVDGVVPLGLGLGAVLSKGIYAKGSAIGLGIYAGLKFFKDVLGFGHYNDLNKKY